MLIKRLQGHGQGNSLFHHDFIRYGGFVIKKPSW